MIGNLVFFIVTGWCGVKLNRLIVEYNGSIAERISFVFLFGFCWFSLIGLLAYGIGWSFSTFSLFYGMASAFIILSEPFFRSKLSNRETFFLKKMNALIALCLIGSVSIAFLGGFMTGDGTFHQAKIQHLLATKRFDNSDPFITSLQDDRYFFSMWHVLWSLCLDFLSDGYRWVPFVWLWLPTLLMPLVVFSQYTFGVALFRQHSAGILMAVLWIIHFIFLAYTDSRFWSDAQILNYPSGFCVHILFPIGAALYLTICEKKHNSFLFSGILIGILIIVIALIHLFYSLLFCLVLTFLCIAMAFQGRENHKWSHKWLFPVLIAFLIFLPWILFRTVTMSPIQNSFFLAPYGWASKFLFLTKKAFILDPKLTYSTLGHYQSDRIVLLAIVISLMCLLKIKRERWAAYVGISTLTVLIMVSVPLFVQLLSWIVTAYKIPRFTLLIPVLPAVTGGLLMFVQLWKRWKNQLVRGILLVIGMTCLFWIYQDSWQRLGFYAKWCREGHMHYARKNPDMIGARNLFVALEKRPRVLGDEGLTYALGAYYPIHAIFLPAAHAAIAFEYRQRNNLFRFMNSELCTLQDLSLITIDHDADYLILKNDRPLIQRLQPIQVYSIGKYDMFDLTMLSLVIDNRENSPFIEWTNRNRWIKIPCADENKTDSWGPSNLVMQRPIPQGIGETFFGREMVSDGLERSLIYTPLLPSPEGRDPRFVSFWLYIEQSKGFTVERMELAWPKGILHMTTEDIQNMDLLENVHKGWNAIAVPIAPNRVVSKTVTEEAPGFVMSIRFKATVPPQTFVCGIRGIHVYMDRTPTME